MQAKSLPPSVRAALRPLQAFFALEAASGVLLAAVALLALGWANSPWGELHRLIFHTEVLIVPGSAGGGLSLSEVINEGLMTLFFFTVGMEIKRERLHGELRETASALLPLAGALGGMVLPALVFLAINRGGPGAAGWGIPMATDIAFALGVLALVQGRISSALPVFLLALAVFDDLGGIAVIALFYGGRIHFDWLAGAAAVTGLLALANRLRLSGWYVYTALGALLWWTMHHSGIHATLAGVLLGFLVPASSRSGQSPLDLFLHALHPWVAYGVVPLFALCNAGIPVAGVSIRDLGSPVFLGIFLGFILGKPLGVWGATAIAASLARHPLPGSVSHRALGGVGVVAGIGFTVALFMAQLAYSDAPHLVAEAKLAILSASLLSSLLGYGWLRLLPTRAPETSVEVART